MSGDWQHISVGAGVNSQSHTESFDRAYEVSGFSTWSARVAYKVSDQLSVAANLNNLFDKNCVIPSYGTTMTYTPTF